MPPISDAPAAVLTAWTALEVLSPPAFRRPETLAHGKDRKAVAPLDGRHLPWEEAGEKARPKTRLYYHIVLGTVDLEPAVARLMSVFADKRAERPKARGEAILATVTVDRDGRPIDEPAVNVSSFGWGLPRALAGDLETLGAWQAAAKSLIEDLDRRIRRPDTDGEPRPLDAALILEAFQWLVATLGVPTDLVKPPVFAIRAYVYFKSPESPEPPLLNSFLLDDLAAAAGQFRTGTATANLQRYLGVMRPERRRDLLHDRAALSSAVRPAAFPPARWPGPGRHPLVLLQQAAVNLAFEELRSSGILAVNGPPGTGKTTLLRDVIAALVTARASVMATLDDPASVFIHSNQKFKAGNAWVHLYRLDERLRGFEMLVASSNNKAVENVSAELPALKAVAEDAPNLRYFKALSDALQERESWGLVAGVLGNVANRSRFKQVFWWDEEVGLSTYLAAAAGTPRMIETKDPASGEIATRPPRIVTEERPPRDREDALRRWRQARTSFLAALKRGESVLKELEVIRAEAKRLPELAAAEALARDRLRAANVAAQQAVSQVRDADRALADARRRRDAASSGLQDHGRSRPGLLGRLFRTSRFRLWRTEEAARGDALRRAGRELDRVAAVAAEAQRRLEQAESAVSKTEAGLKTAAGHLEAATLVVDAARAKLGPRFVDDAFHALDHHQRHRLAPWLDGDAHRVRDDVFIAAMALHRAFVDAAAKPLRHNLGALMNVLGGQSLPGADREALLPDLWASLFLVVPAVSTTFASVERMLGRLPPEALGWLLIDEAGQARPQEAVGAIMRTRRAIVVGDPLQIEPVVVLPSTLTALICRRFGVDPDRFDAPAASVQTLADAATPYMAEFEGRQGSRTVGVPLLVHRRCAEPMFGISNAIAYEGLMVNAKTPGPSAIRDLLGPSRWFDVQGGAEEKWCPQEGELTLGLLRQVARAGIVPDLYVVTPFLVVQDNLRRLLQESGVLRGWTDDPWAWVSERVGTIHTVQGREAEAVILVLGAPAPNQTGARGWAGNRPNLLNVAATRAKEAMYVVGNRQLWRDAGLFRELDARMAI